MSSINGSLISPLLVSRGAGPVALGNYNSLANLLGYSAGFGGPQLAQKLQSVSKTTLLCVGIGRLVFLTVPLALIAVSGGGAPLIMSLILVWALGEGLALPLWASFVASMASAEDRGRWLAMRGTAATGASAAVMIAIFILLRTLSQNTVFPIAYGFAAAGGVISWFQVRLLTPLQNRLLCHRRNELGNSHLRRQRDDFSEALSASGSARDSFGQCYHRTSSTSFTPQRRTSREWRSSLRSAA